METGEITLTGMVLSAMTVGEYDRRLVILTKERGKITAFARGARRPTSRTQAASQPFAMGKFRLYPGKNAYSLLGAELSFFFTDLGSDLETVSYGSYFAELASYYTRENIPAADILNLLYVSLKALGRQSVPNRLVRLIYEIRIMISSGEFPDPRVCGKCGKELNHSGKFFPTRSYILCENCSADLPGGYHLSETAVYVLQRIAFSPLQSLYTFTVNDRIREELEIPVRAYEQKIIDRSFHSAEMLDFLETN